MNESEQHASGDRLDYTEPVRLVAVPETWGPSRAGTHMADAICRYTLVGDEWRGMLTEISPAGIVLEGPCRIEFVDGRSALIRVTARHPRDRRRVYYAGEGAWPGSPGPRVTHPASLSPNAGREGDQERSDAG